MRRSNASRRPSRCWRVLSPSWKRPPAAVKAPCAARIALAFLKFSSGEREEAVALTERSLADISAVKGADHLDAADLMVTLAQMRLELGAYAEAERLAVAAQAIYSSKAPESRQLIRTRTILGSVRLAQGRTREAIDLYSDVLAALQQRFGADSGEIQSALADIGRAHFVAGEFREAAAALERSVALTEKVAAIDAATAFANRTGRIEDHAVARAAVFDFLVKAYDRHRRSEPRANAGRSRKKPSSSPSASSNRRRLPRFRKWRHARRPEPANWLHWCANARISSTTGNARTAS